MNVENTKNEETATAHVCLTEPLTTEQARVLAAQWVGHERNEWDKALDAAEVDALRGWVRAWLANAAEGLSAIAGEFYGAFPLGDDEKHDLVFRLADALDLPDDWGESARTLCDEAGWPS